MRSDKGRCKFVTLLRTRWLCSAENRACVMRGILLSSARVSSHWKQSMIRNGLKISAAASALLFTASMALANGVVTQRKAGGLVFTKTDTISIASEDLYISRDEIRVSY